MDTQRRKTFTMFIDTSLRRVLILFVLVMLALLIISLGQSWAGSENENGYYEELWPDNASISGNIRSSSAVIGSTAKADISDSTITDDLDYFDDDRIKSILYELARKPVDPGDDITIITNISGNLYGFEAEFPTATATWNVYFPAGKELDPAGTFDAAIWGVNAHSYSLIPGAGGIYRGIQFSLADEEWPAGTKGWGLFQLVDAKTAVVFYSPSGGADSVTIPSHMPDSGLASNVLRFE